jgi:hypothetical protein
MIISEEGGKVRGSSQSSKEGQSENVITNFFKLCKD